MTRTFSVSFAVLVLTSFAFAASASADSYYPYTSSAPYDHGYSRWDSDDNDRDDRIPSCEITAHPNTVSYNREMRLTWESDYADYADITDIGRVSPDGSRTIYVNDSKTYYMTVYNGSQSASCSTFVNVLGDEYRGQYPYNYSHNYTYPAYSYPSYTYATPTYVSLTQIPYTGFDFGTVGNAIYWTMLGVIAIAGAYILVYMSGFQALVSFVPVGLVGETVQAGRIQARAVRNVVTRRRVESTPASIEAAPVVAAEMPAKRGLSTDAMQKVVGGTPRIVITRE